MFEADMMKLRFVSYLTSHISNLSNSYIFEPDMIELSGVSYLKSHISNLNESNGF